MFRSFIQQLSRKNRKKGPQAVRRPLKTRLGVEHLEDRVVPTTTNVTMGTVFNTATQIQDAINAANPGDVIQVDTNYAVGTSYQTQLYINKTLTLRGVSGASGKPEILAPTAGLTSLNAPPAGITGVANDTHEAIITIYGAGTVVTLTNFTISGPSDGLDSGVYVRDGSANITNDVITEIQDQTTFGVSGVGFGIRVGAGANGAFTGSSGTATISGNAITAYQKEGILIENNSVAQISANVITGVGPTTVIAQNGIQISDGSVARIGGNSNSGGNIISGNEYTGVGSGPDPFNDTQAAGLFYLDAGTGNVCIGNTLDGNDIGIYNASPGCTITSNMLGSTSPNRFEGMLFEQGSTAAQGNIIQGGNVGILITSFNGATGTSDATLTGNKISNTFTGIQVESDTTGGATTENVALMGGNAVGSSVTGIELDSGTTSITGATINGAPGAGIFVFGGTLTGVTMSDLSGNARGMRILKGNVTGGINFNNFANDSLFAIDNTLPQEVDATSNFFGTSVNNGLVNGAAALSSPPSAQPVMGTVQGNEVFVSAIYKDLLHRPADQEGFNAWVALLNSGQLTPQQVAFGIEQSPEYQGDVIDQLYVKLLGRHIEPGGVAFYLNLYAQGVTTLQIEADIVASPEFFAHSGGTNATFVGAAYEDILNRPATQDEINGWVAALNGGLTRDQFANGIVFSQEGLNAAVQQMYITFLRRPGQPDEVSAWAALMMQGESVELVQSAILATQEYLNLF
jgi:hypothetical protein